MPDQQSSDSVPTMSVGTEAQKTERLKKLKGKKKPPRTGTAEFAGLVSNLSCECRTKYGEVYRCPCTVS